MEARSTSSKDDSKSNTAAASEAGRATVDTVARESEGESKKHSSNEERVTAAASTDKSALVDMTLPETEGGSTVCSSEAAIPRGGSALLEHRRPDGGRLHLVGKMMMKQVQKHS